MATDDWREDNIEKLRKYRKDWYERNKESEQIKARQRRKEGRQEVKIWLKELKQTLKCKSCLESDWRCLDFHHRDPNTKSFTIAKSWGSWTKSRIEKEIDKCDVLCANCHRKLHGKNWV